MAQAAFFVNALKITEKGKIVILEGQRQCEHGKVADQVFLTFPAELKRVLVEYAGAPAEQSETPDAASRSVWKNRLEKYFDQDN